MCTKGLCTCSLQPPHLKLLLLLFLFQSQPGVEYSVPELQAPRSNVADKPWPQVHPHTQRPHGEASACPVCVWGLAFVN